MSARGQQLAPSELHHGEDQGHGDDRHVDPRLAFLARAAARLALVEAGEMDLDEADPETLSEPDDDWRGWDREAWALAARDYHEQRGNRVSLVEYTPAQLARLRRLMADNVSLERAWAELSKPPQVPVGTLHAAEFLLHAKDPARMRRWLSRHSAPERKAILRHLEQHKKGGGGGNGW